MPLILVSPYKKIVQAIIDAYKGFGASTVLLMHMEGANNGPFFTDETGKSITRGGAMITSNAKFKFGSTSAYFGTDQSSTYRLILPQSSDFAFGTGDFCIEMQVYLTQYSGQWGTFLYDGRTYDGAMNGGNNGPILFVNPNGTVQGGLGAGKGLPKTTDVLTLNAWHHVALMRFNGVVFVSLDGKFSSSIADNTSAVCDTTPFIGCASNRATSTTLCGYVDEVRITKGYGRYDVPFTPPIAEFLNPVDKFFNFVSLLMNMEIVEGKSATDFANLMGGAYLSKIGAPILSQSKKNFGASSLYLDGDSCLTAPVSVGQFGSGDFTIECFVNQSGINRNYNCIFANYNVWGTGVLSLFAGHQDDVGRYVVGCNGTFPALRSSTLIKFNEWVHLCIERTGATIRLYVNGIIEASVLNGATLNGNGGNFFLGTAGNSVVDSMFKGYIDEFRITKAARYKGVNFTVPAEAYPKHGL